MAELNVAAISTSQPIIIVEGKAFLRDDMGRLVPLKVGDPLLDGQTLVTDAQGYAKLQMPNGDFFEIGPNRELKFDTELASAPPVDQSEAALASTQTVSDQILGALAPSIDLSTDLDPTAAGLIAGVGTDEGHGFVRLTRIVEGINPLAFSFEAAQTAEQQLQPLSDPDVVAPEGNDAPDAVNDGPDALLDALRTPEDSALTIAPATILANDTDPESDPLTITSVQNPVNGTVALVDGQIVFTPDADYHGPASFTYTISDGQGGTDTATVNIDVTPMDDVFTDADEVVSVDEDTTLNGTVLAGTSSIEGPVTVTGFTVGGTNYAAGATASLTEGQLTIREDGSYTFVPAANFNGPVPTATYTLTDGSSGDTSTLSITVNPMDDAFTDADEVVSVNEDTTLNGTVLSGTSSVDGPVTVTGFTVGGTSYATGATASLTEGQLTIREDGSYTFVPAANFNGPVPTATYTLTDGSSGDTSTLSITVNPVNDAPAGVADARTTVEGSITLQASVLGNDTDIDVPTTLTVTQVKSSTNAEEGLVGGSATITTALGGTVVINGDGSFTYTAPVRSHADAVPDQDSFSYVATDGTAYTDWTTVTIDLTDTNPTAIADGAWVPLGGTVNGSLLNNDVAIDSPATVTSVTFNGTTQTIAAGGSATFDTPKGLLTVHSDGSYSYTSQVPAPVTPSGDTVDEWESSGVVGMSGFLDGNMSWQDGSKLNINPVLLENAEAYVKYQGGSKDGFGVANTGSKAIGDGENLIIQLQPTKSVTLGIEQFNAAQTVYGTWFAYDAAGTQIATADFAGLNANGDYFPVTITTTSDIAYLRLTFEADGTNNQGYLISDLTYTPSPTPFTETFSYTMSDSDTDTSGSTLVINGINPVTLDSDDSPYTGTSAADSVQGSAVADTISGGGGDDALYGGTGDDDINGGAGADYIVGGSGSDDLIGGLGSDTFAWKLGDHGADGTPDVDTVTGFDTALPAAGGDMLDLRDLLQGEHAADHDLTSFLHFEQDGADTVVHVSSSGAFSSGYTAGSEDLQIVLENVDLTSIGNDQAIIQDLINKGKLQTD